MRKPHVTAERLRELFNYDPETGVFTRRIDRAGCRAGSVSDCHDTRGYIVIRIDGRLYRANRLAWLYVHGELSALEIDHKNRVPDDNRIENLRPVTPLRNRLNVVTANRGSSTGVLGVSPKRKRFVAAYAINGKRIYIGTYDTVEEASAAYWAVKHARDPEAVIVPRAVNE